MNDDKTEEVHVYLSKRDDVDSSGKSLVDNEDWRSSKLLGSLLCSVKDITHRIILGNIAFNNFRNIWMKGKKISLARRLRVYDAQVVSILLYNSGSWAAPEHVFKKLDTCHRRHLRSILSIKWPQIISNEELYKRTGAKPLTARVEESRWKLFGHILRSMETTPASSSLVFAIDSNKKLKGRRGRHRINLLSVLKKDLTKRKIYLKLTDLDDVYYLRELASDRLAWLKLM